MLTNLVPSIPDERDYRFPVSPGWPPQGEVDLRSYAGRRLDQFVGSCTAESTVNACELLHARASVVDPLSRLFLYYNTRAIENRIGEEGAQTRNALRSALHHGVCDDETWPNSRGMVDVEPNAAAKAEGLTQKLMRYECLYHYRWGSLAGFGYELIRAMKWALAEGLPLVYAFRVGRDFMSLSGPLGEQRYSHIDSSNPHVGNHAVCVQGYTGQTPYGFILENSWGTDWGDQGFGLLSDSVILRDTIEIWAVRGFAGQKIKPAPGIMLRECTRYHLATRIAVAEPVTTNVWVGAKMNGAWLIKTSAGWSPFNPMSEPPAAFMRDVTIADELDVVVVDGTDLRPFAGAEVHIAYGSDPLTWTRAKVVTVPKF